jgi:TolA-binding protein
LFAQQNEEQLAAQFLGNGEYEKAADMYEKLLNKNPSSTYLYDNLLNCYIKIRDWNQAEKLVKRQQKRFSDQMIYQVDLAYIKQLSGNTDKLNKYLDDLIKNLDGSDSKTTQLAAAFQKRNFLNEAIRTYLRARQLNGNQSIAYALPLAQLYGQTQNVSQMVEEYLNAIQQNPRIVGEVQELLQDYAVQPTYYESIRTTLLKRLKVYPDNETMQDLLIWLYVQKKDFNNAFVQARALDKRYKEEGKRLIELGQIATQNQAYDAAINMFGYVIQFGKDKPHYLTARMNQLDARKQKILFATNHTQEDLLVLENEYKSFLDENGRYHFTARIMRDLARLYIYQLNRRNDGIALYEEIINQPRIDHKFKGTCKLELGDIYLLMGEEWEAMLLYGQVDKDFKEDPLGQEAKFRNATLSYYLGEFEWARAQLDVLKTATTQLMANNALELSLLIQDNTIDSNEEPLRMYANADLYYYQMSFVQSIQILDSLTALYPRHSLADDVLYKRAQIALAQKNYNLANEFLKQIIKEHGSGIWGDNAMFMLAEMNHTVMNNTETAIEYYNQLLATYPGSFFTTEARKRIRTLRNDPVN